MFPLGNVASHSEHRTNVDQCRENGWCGMRNVNCHPYAYLCEKQGGSTQPFYSSAGDTILLEQQVQSQRNVLWCDVYGSRKAAS